MGFIFFTFTFYTTRELKHKHGLVMTYLENNSSVSFFLDKKGKLDEMDMLNSSMDGKVNEKFNIIWATIVSPT